jgi:peptidoglycan/xylan/chitin deacetylase (PgdA/CDA1 family)
MRALTVLLGIDDFNPGVIGEDSAELKRLLKLFEEFPEVKATCFCAAKYSYTNDPVRNLAIKNIQKLVNLKVENDSNLLSKNKGWAKKISDIKNISLELHGYTHFNPSLGTCEEFKGITKDETCKKLADSQKEFIKIRAKPRVFAPPGWAMNEHIYSFCSKNHISIANSFYNIKTKKYSGEKINPMKQSVFNGTLCIPRNVDIHNGNVSDIKHIIKNKGLISFHGHAKNIGVSNGLTEGNAGNLRELIAWIKENHDPTFKFFREIKRGA